MWHTTEIVKIFEKITEDYGYEIYQNRKRCVALCSDLLVEYSTEKNIMQMLFQVGLGEAMKGVPFKNERELKIGLSSNSLITGKVILKCKVLKFFKITG